MAVTLRLGFLTAQNEVLCRQKSAHHGPTSDGHEECKTLWNDARQRSMSLFEAVEEKEEEAGRSAGFSRKCSDHPVFGFAGFRSCRAVPGMVVVRIFCGSVKIRRALFVVIW